MAFKFRTEAVRLVRESGKSIQQVAADLGVSEASLRHWMRQAQIDAGQRSGLTSTEREELTRLRRGNRILRVPPVAVLGDGGHYGGV